MGQESKTATAAEQYEALRRLQVVRRINWQKRAAAARDKKRKAKLEARGAPAPAR